MSSDRVLCLFLRRTRATPIDKDVVINRYPGLLDDAKEVHISVTFTWDISRAKKLASVWEKRFPVKIGGPAMNMAGADFEPGMYLKKGYVITSRGCPNKCWFCSVWRREGSKIRELPIREGWNVLDDNILACSEKHVRKVFKMLHSQKNPVEFTGGLEAARLQDWHVDLLADLKPKQMFFAYDTPDDYEPLVMSGKKLLEIFPLSSRRLRAYVLIGYPKDTFEKAEIRLRQSWKAGFFPMAMLWRDESGEMNTEWRKFQRLWARPAITINLLKNVGGWRKQR